MKRVLMCLALAAVGVAFGPSCIDFQGAIEDCQEAGGCVDENAAADGGAGTDAGQTDGGDADAGGQLDAGAEEDAGEADSGTTDAGQDAGFDGGIDPFDAGSDAGSVDAGWCGGKWCLFSSGSSGVFEINPGVFASSPTRAFGVGWGTRVVQWNGTKWSSVDINPSSGGDDLRAIWGHDDELIAASGNTSWYRFDGQNWVHQGYMPGLDRVNWIHGLGDGGSVYGAMRGPRVVKFEASMVNVDYQGGTSLDDVNGVFVVAEDDVWAVGDKGLVLHKEQAQWTVLDAGVTSDLYRVWAGAADDVWMVGGSGAVVHWDGAQLSRRNYAGNTLYGVFGTDAGEVYAVGAQGTFIRWSPDAGDWEDLPVPGDGDFFGVWGGGPNDLFMSGLPDGGYGVTHFRR